MTYYIEDSDGLVPVEDIADWASQEAAEAAALALSATFDEVFRIYEGLTPVSLVYRGAVWAPGELTTED